MKKMFLMSALALSGAISASAELVSNASFETSTSQSGNYKYSDKQTHNYAIKETGQGMSQNGYPFYGSTGRTDTRQISIGTGSIGSINFGVDARYEFTFTVHFDNPPSDGVRPVANFFMVNDMNSVSLLLGNAYANGVATECRMGEFHNIDAATTTKLCTLDQHAGSSLTDWFWSTTSKNEPINNGDYTYKLIIEAFADPSMADEIDFGVSVGNSSYTFTNLDSTYLHCGGNTSQVFDDLGFVLLGDAYAGVDPAAGTTGNGVRVMSASLTKYTREKIEEPAVPEPSAFGLLAGLGAIVLAASRRRRSR